MVSHSLADRAAGQRRAISHIREALTLHSGQSLSRVCQSLVRGRDARARCESERRVRRRRESLRLQIGFVHILSLGTDTNPIQHTHTRTDEPQEGVRVQATLLLSTSRSSHSHITRSCATGRLDCPCALVRENLRHRAGTSARLRHHRRATCQVEVCTRSRPPPCKSVASPPASGEPQRASSPCSRTGAGTRRRA